MSVSTSPAAAAVTTVAILAGLRGRLRTRSAAARVLYRDIRFSFLSERTNEDGWGVSTVERGSGGAGPTERARTLGPLCGPKGEERTVPVR